MVMLFDGMLGMPGPKRLTAIRRNSYVDDGFRLSTTASLSSLPTFSTAVSQSDHNSVGSRRFSDHILTILLFSATSDSENPELNEEFDDWRIPIETFSPRDSDFGWQGSVY